MGTANHNHQNHNPQKRSAHRGRNLSTEPVLDGWTQKGKDSEKRTALRCPLVYCVLAYAEPASQHRLIGMMRIIIELNGWNWSPIAVYKCEIFVKRNSLYQRGWRV